MGQSKPNPDFESYEEYLAEKEGKLRDAIHDALGTFYVPQGMESMDINVNLIETSKVDEYYRSFTVEEVNINVDVSF